MIRVTVAAATLTLFLVVPAEAPASTPTNDAAVLVGKAERLTPRQYVYRTARSAGYSRQEWKCLDSLIQRESSWNPRNKSKISSAFGLFQQLKLDTRAGVRKQTRLGLKYIKHRYGTACAAMAFHRKHGYY